MKRSKMINKIYKLLKTWDNCKIEKRTAKEVLDLIEEEGMVPPSRKIVEPLGGGLNLITNGHFWDSEK